MDLFSQLTVDQLAQILSHVDIKHRLSSCSLVNSTWRAAAARATTSIQTLTASVSASWKQWLRSHTADVAVSSLEIVVWGNPTELSLPLAQLQSLKSLKLHRIPWRPGPEAAYTAAQPQPLPTIINSSRKHGLEHLTALTGLSLNGSSVRLEGLPALTGLQELSCEGTEQGGVKYGIPNCEAAEGVLVVALPKLQRLTSLTLGNIASAAVVAHVSSLQSLQQLTLRVTTADSFAGLPKALTKLSLGFRQPGSITHSNATCISQLTALQSLALQNVRALDTSLLTSMRGLQNLQLTDVQLAAGNLKVLSHFTALTSLTIDSGKEAYDSSRPPASITAAEAPALTSSSQLASLTLGGKPGQLQPQDYGSLFPPGRQLQHLTALTVSADILSSTAAVHQAGSCCPNLHKVSLSYPKPCEPWVAPPFHTPWAAGEGEQVAAGLAAMSSWGQLRELSLNARAYQLPKPIWEVLGTLAQLTSLEIRCMPAPGIGLDSDDVLRLEDCTALQSLYINAEGARTIWLLEIRSKAPPGSPPDVWLQLADEVLATPPLPDTFW